MADKLIDSLSKSPSALNRYEAIQVEAAKYIGTGECPPLLTDKIKDFSRWLQDSFGQRVTGKELALARLRHAAGKKRISVERPEVTESETQTPPRGLKV